MKFVEMTDDVLVRIMNSLQSSDAISVGATCKQMFNAYETIGKNNWRNQSNIVMDIVGDDIQVKQSGMGHEWWNMKGESLSKKEVCLERPFENKTIKACTLRNVQFTEGFCVKLVQLFGLNKGLSTEVLNVISCRLPSDTVVRKDILHRLFCITCAMKPKVVNYVEDALDDDLANPRMPIGGINGITAWWTNSLNFRHRPITEPTEEVDELQNLINLCNGVALFHGQKCEYKKGTITLHRNNDTLLTSYSTNIIVSVHLNAMRLNAMRIAFLAASQ